MGADDYHVSAELTEELRRRWMIQRYKRIEEAAWKWEAGELSAERFAELVFALINEEAT